MQPKAAYSAYSLILENKHSTVISDNLWWEEVPRMWKVSCGYNFDSSLSEPILPNIPLEET